MAAGAVGSMSSARRGAIAVPLLLALALFIGAPRATAEEAPAPAAPAAASAAPAATTRAQPDATDKNMEVVPIVLAREQREEPLPISLLDLPPADLGVAGAKLAIMDNNTTGRFMNQKFQLDVVEEADADKLIKDIVQKVDGGTHFVLADVAPQTLLKLSDALAGKEAEIINYAAPDDRLREEDCRANVMHTAPTRTMLADALAQYLIWKKWNRWFLVLGPQEGDKLFADALKRAAKRFGGKIVEERTFQYQPGSRRSDGGYEQIQQQIPTFTQSAPDYDVLIVADEGNLFGEYLPYRTWDARPLPAPRASSPRAGIRRSSCGAERSSRTASSAWRTATCVRATTTPGWPRAWSARRHRAPSRTPTRT